MNVSKWGWAVAVLVTLLLGGLLAAENQPSVSLTSTLAFRDGTFKIVLFADTHIATWEKAEKGDGRKLAAEKKLRLLADMGRILDAEKPDLVIFTGDNIARSEIPFRLLKELLAPVTERNLPFAAVMGNHDAEWTGKSQAELMAFLAKQPNSLCSPGAVELGGGGNYRINLTVGGKPAYTLYLLDSGDYSTDIRHRGYAWLKPEQIDWLEKQIRKQTEANQGTPIPSLLFFHIPLREYLPAEGDKLAGHKNEGVSAATYNPGLFARMVKAKSVIATFCGHDHNNDYILCKSGICLGYARKTGDFGYADLPSGARVIQLYADKPKFKTWIRLADDTEENRITCPDDLQK